MRDGGAVNGCLAKLLLALGLASLCLLGGVRAVSDSDALDGEQGGYVPCGEAAADLPATDDDSAAVAGHETGYVPIDGLAAGLPADTNDSDAISGHEVGFVARPCCAFLDTFSRTNGVIAVTDPQVLAGWPSSAWYSVGDADTGQQWFDVTETDKVVSVIGPPTDVIPPSGVTIDGTAAAFSLPDIDIPTSATNQPALTASHATAIVNTTRTAPLSFPITLCAEIRLSQLLQTYSLLGVPNTNGLVQSSGSDGLSIATGTQQLFGVARGAVDGLYHFGAGSTGNALAIPATTHFYIKARWANGSQVFFKAWPDGSAEPAYSGPFGYPGTLQYTSLGSPIGYQLSFSVARSAQRNATANAQVNNIPQRVHLTPLTVYLDQISFGQEGDCCP